MIGSGYRLQYRRTDSDADWCRFGDDAAYLDAEAACAAVKYHAKRITTGAVRAITDDGVVLLAIQMEGTE